MKVDSDRSVWTMASAAHRLDVLVGCLAQATNDAANSDRGHVIESQWDLLRYLLDKGHENAFILMLTTLKR